MPRLSLTRRRLLGLAAYLAAGGLTAACGSSSRRQQAPTAVGAATYLPQLPATPTAAAPDGRPESVWVDFVGLWNLSEYAAMYALLSPEAQARASATEFARYHQDLSARAGLRQVGTEITSSLVDGATAQVGYVKTLQTDVYGAIVERQSVRLSAAGGRWLLDWQPEQVLQALDYGCSLNISETANLRGAIYDRFGRPLAAFGARVVVGVVPGEVKDEAAMLEMLARVLEDDAEAVRARYANAGRPDWFMPVGELSAEQAQEHYADLSPMPGVLLREKPVRLYPEGPTCAHLTGYVGVITQEQLASMRPAGYREDDVVGQAGIERSFEQDLAGKRGSRLLVIGPGGDVRATAFERPAEPSRSLYTAIDLPLQRLAMSLLEGSRGGIVALDPRDGQVLVMASSPSFDPNAIMSGMSVEQWTALLEDEGRPLVNRACQAELPPGSVFKVVTETAALDTGVLQPQSGFTCNGVWSGLGSAWTVRCWLASGHGNISLERGLTASCNVVFAEAGRTLHDHDREALPRYAKAFGYGTRTGIGAVGESTGLVPTPAWKEQAVGESWFPGDSVNLAIGQGHLLVTVLQVANMLAAAGNGGTLYRPQLARGSGQSAAEVEAPVPEAIGQLPLRPEHLASIRTGLVDGCMTPGGTAYAALGSLSVPVAGKTGTAENPGTAPHAWFAGYAPADNPTIAIAIVVEHGGQGSLVAAPLFRRLVEAHLGLGG